MTPEAERFNGWAAMLGFVAAVGAYVTTGQIIPGWFQVLKSLNFIIFLIKLFDYQSPQLVIKKTNNNCWFFFVNF